MPTCSQCLAESWVGGPGGSSALSGATVPPRVPVLRPPRLPTAVEPFLGAMGGVWVSGGGEGYGGGEGASGESMGKRGGLGVACIIWVIGAAPDAGPRVDTAAEPFREAEAREGALDAPPWGGWGRRMRVGWGGGGGGGGWGVGGAGQGWGAQGR